MKEILSSSCSPIVSKHEFPETEYVSHSVNSIIKSGIINIIHFSYLFCRKVINSK